MTRTSMTRHESPVTALLRLQSALDEASGRARGWFGSGLSGRGAFPAMNVLRDDAGYVLRFEVPGLEAEEISLQSQGQTLTISGKRGQDAAFGSLHRSERWAGEFQRSIELPRDLDPGGATAEYRRGVLTIRVPVREDALPRSIPVEAG